MSAKPTRLVITGARETVPRELAATGKACGGTFSVVVRPRIGEARVVLTVKREVKGAVFQAPDHPAVPAMLMSPAEARALLAAGKDSGAATDATLQGSWSGTITCAEDGAELHLHRKAGPVTLHVRSAKGGKGWLAHVEREATWYGPAGSTKPQAHEMLADACRAAAGLATASASEVCGVRTVGRRAAHDASYAAAHPGKPEPERRSPIDRMDAALARLVAVAPTRVEAKKPGKAAKLTPAEQAVELAGRVPQIEVELATAATLPAGLKRSEALIRHAADLIRTNCSGAAGADAAAKVEEAVRLHNAALAGGPEAAVALRGAIRHLAGVAARAAKTTCAYNDAVFAPQPAREPAPKPAPAPRPVREPAPATPRAPGAPRNAGPATSRAPRSGGRMAVVRIGDPPSGGGADAGKDRRLMGMVGGMLGDALREMDQEG